MGLPVSAPIKVPTPVRTSLAREGLFFCVCFACTIHRPDGSIDVPFRQYRGEPVPLAEAERRLAWGRRTYPEIVYWLERV